MHRTDTRHLTDSTQRRNGFRQLPRASRRPWFLRGCATVRLTLVTAFLILLILTIALPAWVLTQASRAERDADLPDSRAFVGGAAGSGLHIPHADVNHLATACIDPDGRTSVSARILRRAVRAGELACPPPAL